MNILSQIPESEPHHKIQFNVIPMTLFFGRGSYSLSKGCGLQYLDLTDMAYKRFKCNCKFKFSAKTNEGKMGSDPSNSKKHMVQWENCCLNYAKMKIILTSNFIRYIYLNYMKISSNTGD